MRTAIDVEQYIGITRRKIQNVELALLLAVTLAGCTQSTEEKTNMPVPFRTVESAVQYVDAYNGKPEDLRLPIADEIQDATGLNMVIVCDKILAKGFMPDGFEQKDGFRVYKYKAMDEENP